MIIRRCVPEIEQGGIMEKHHASPYRGNFAGDKTTQKNSPIRFLLAYYIQRLFEWVNHCDNCQRMGNIIRRNEMPLQGILVV